MKFVKRRVLWALVDSETTSRGNPVSYDFYLECGHTRSEYHNPTAVGTMAMWAGALAKEAAGVYAGSDFPELGCRGCTDDKPLTYYDRLRLGRLPIRALEMFPGLQAAWDKVKELPKPEVV